MEYFIKGFKNFANFSGRERRKDYWLFVLTYSLIYVVLKLIGPLLGTDLLSSVFSLVIFVPSISYATRRLHDVGKSGWWQLILIIPLIGLIVLIVFLAQDSEKGENAYGVSPKYP